MCFKGNIQAIRFMIFQSTQLYDTHSTIILFFGINPSEVLAQSANTTNATNSTAAGAGEVSPITVVIPTGSEITTGSGDMSQIQ